MKKRILIIRVIAVIILISVMGAIFYLSSRPAKKSSRESKTVTVRICRIFYPNFKTMTNPQQKKVVKKVHPPVRKIAHFTLFSALGAMAFLSVITYKSIRYYLRVGISLVFSVLYAVSDEIHQIFVAGRGPRAADVLIDSAGIIFVTVILLLVFKLKFIKRFFDLEES